MEDALGVTPAKRFLIDEVSLTNYEFSLLEFSLLDFISLDSNSDLCLLQERYLMHAALPSAHIKVTSRGNHYTFYLFIVHLRYTQLLIQARLNPFDHY